MSMFCVTVKADTLYCTLLYVIYMLYSTYLLWMVLVSTFYYNRRYCLNICAIINLSTSTIAIIQYYHCIVAKLPYSKLVHYKKLSH